MGRRSHSTVWRLGKRIKTRDLICPVDSGFFPPCFLGCCCVLFSEFNCFGYQNLLCHMPLVACHQWFVMLQRHIFLAQGLVGLDSISFIGEVMTALSVLFPVPATDLPKSDFYLLSGVSSSIIDIVRSVLTLPSPETSQSLISSSPWWPEPLRVWRMRVASGLGASSRGPRIPHLSSCVSGLPAGAQRVFSTITAKEAVIVHLTVDVVFFSYPRSK